VSWFQDATTVLGAENSQVLCVEVSVAVAVIV
jgi:hypothetical protein